MGAALQAAIPDAGIANDNNRNSIYIDEEMRALIPPLSEEERSTLERNILANGCRDPLSVWNGMLIDGHNRYEICVRNGLPFQVVDVEFESKSHARIWMRDNQMGRRNITDAWKIELQLANKEDLKAIGRERQTSEAGRRPNTGGDLLSKNDRRSEIDRMMQLEPSRELPPLKHDTRKTLASAAGVSTGKLAQAEYVKKTAPEIWEQAKAGERTIGNAYAEVKKEEKKVEREKLIQGQREAIASGAVELPTGEYEVVAMDPPWNYGREYDPKTSRVANPYPEMTQSQLLEMEPPFAKDCVLFLWTTHQFIWDAKQLLDHWGFTYKANLVWDKEHIGMGAWLRMQCEFCLVGIRGKPTWDNTRWRDIIREPRREHSRKPEAFYEMVQDITVGRRLDFFSREAREGWASFGNDKDKFQ